MCILTHRPRLSFLVKFCRYFDRPFVFCYPVAEAVSIKCFMSLHASRLLILVRFTENEMQLAGSSQTSRLPTFAPETPPTAAAQVKPAPSKSSKSKAVAPRLAANSASGAAQGNFFSANSSSSAASSPAVTGATAVSVLSRTASRDLFGEAQPAKVESACATKLQLRSAALMQGAGSSSEQPASRVVNCSTFVSRSNSFRVVCVQPSASAMSAEASRLFDESGPNFDLPGNETGADSGGPSSSSSSAASAQTSSAPTKHAPRRPTKWVSSMLLQLRC